MQKAHEQMRERIIETLAEGPREKVALRDEVVGTKLTVQGFYKALARLRAEEVVTVHKGSVSLAVVWIQHQMRRLEEMASVYGIPAYRSYFGSLKNGKRLSFTFKNLRELDLFWTQAALIAIEGAPKDTPVISFLPHDWFDVVRPSSSEIWFKMLGKRNPHVNVITYATREEKKLSEHPGVTKIENMFGENPLQQKESDYVNMIGDLIFEVKLDESVLSGIRNAMRGEPVDINKLTAKTGVFKLSIKRDPAKALALKKKIQKYFSIRLF